MPGRQFNSNSYRYGYQKQEIDQELWGGAVSFKYRIEDPRLGRFFSVDPLRDDFPWNSPYAFSENRVIDGIELEGLEVILVQNKGKDKIIYEAALKDKDKSVVSIYAHGEYRGFHLDPKNQSKTDNGWVKTAEEFDDVLQKLSPEYKAARQENEEIVVVIHSCRAGKETTHGLAGKPRPSVAKLASTIPGVTVIAPDERIGVAVGKDGPYEMGPLKPAEGAADKNSDWKSKDEKDHKYSGERGTWNTFKKGNIVDQNQDLNKAKENAKESTKGSD